MEKEYIIDGMTCNGCVSSVQKSLEALEEVEKVSIDLASKVGVLELRKAVPTKKLQQAIGHYTIKEKASNKIVNEVDNLPEKSITTYKPLILIVSFIAGVSLLAQYPFSDFSGMLWMRHFMAGFFIVFAFFKLLNIKGFAMSYQMYDIVAARWNAWGYIYPFVELGLGILFLINIAPVLTNWATIITLGISSIGVIRSNLKQQKIKCACLGDVFNLPMSTVTVVEDLTMVAMAVLMLIF